MAVREYWEIKWIEWIAVQENWVTQVSLADTVNIVWWGTVTDVGWVATINIPYGVTWYREDVTAGSATYTFVHSPATSNSFLVFTDSGTLMFLGVDYTYNASTETITFLSLGNDEAAYIWVAHASVTGGWIWDMVKAVYDPTNINSSAFDYNNFINTPDLKTVATTGDYDDLTNKPTLATVATSWDYDDLLDKPTIPTTVAELSDASDYVTDTELSTTLGDYALSSSVPTNTSDLNNDSWFITSSALSGYALSSEIPTKTSELQNDSWFLTSAWDVDWPNSSTDWNIVVFDWATGKAIKDSWLSIQTTSSIPTWASICDVYYKDWVIYLYTWAVRDAIILES